MIPSQYRSILPFSAITGQEQMKKALLLNAVNPRIGGVLIRGEKGTAKSTAVRALAELLPELDVVKGCPFNCSPVDIREMCENCRSRFGTAGTLEMERKRVRVVDLPLGVTEDRVVGTIDIECAIKEGRKVIEPGILAAANRGILYIDEVNLLDDRIADLLLDAAALGMNIVEREGISFSHPARFILIGTMNPEEGEIRPQLLDRFGLQVTVEAIDDHEQRMEIIRTSELFDKKPEAFISMFQRQQEQLHLALSRAKLILPDVTIHEDLLATLVTACMRLGIKTHRAEIAVARTARTIAALEGRTEVTSNDIREAMELALPHRLRRKPFEDPKIDPEQLDDVITNAMREHHQKTVPQRPADNDTGRGPDRENPSGEPGGGQSTGGTRELLFGIGDPIDARKLYPPESRDREPRRNPDGRRMETLASGKVGTYISSRNPAGNRDLALDATIRAASSHTRVREAGRLAIAIRDEDLREKVRVGRISARCVIVVDASGSMGAMKRMEAAKGAVLSLLVDSYQHRDRIGMVAFRGERAEIVLPLCRSVDLARKCLSELPTGGKTPLGEGIWKGIEMLEQERRRNGEIVPVMILITDGRANFSRTGNVRADLQAAAHILRKRGVRTVVIDTEDPKSASVSIRLGYGREIAKTAGGRHYPVGDLRTETVERITSREIAAAFS